MIGTGRKKRRMTVLSAFGEFLSTVDLKIGRYGSVSAERTGFAALVEKRVPNDMPGADVALHADRCPKIKWISWNSEYSAREVSNNRILQLSA